MRTGLPLRRGFTLIELLVVIAIISLLVAILLPSLAQARALARLTKDSSSARQLTVAWTNYNNDNKEHMLPGYSHWNWAHGPNRRIQLMAFDSRKNYMEGTGVKPWPWRLAPFHEYNHELMITDDRTRDRFTQQLPWWTAPRPSPAWGDPSNDPPGGTAQYKMSWNPSFGLNAAYVGGSFMHGAFFDWWGPSGSRYATSSQGYLVQNKKRWYVTRTADVKDPSKLIVFGTARDTDGTPGNWLIQAPSSPNYGYGLVSGAQNWPTFAAKPNWNPARPAGDYGNVDCRYVGKLSITSMIDGHVEALKINDLYDMRRWSNDATSANWNFTTAPFSTGITATAPAGL